jgi:hypothetical protein
MPRTRTENLAADYFAAKRSRKFAETGEYIVASVSQLAYGLTVHLAEPIVTSGAATPRLELFCLHGRAIGGRHLTRASFYGNGSWPMTARE